MTASRLLLPLLAALALGFAPAPLPRRDSQQSDLKRLQGGWVLIRETRRGEELRLTPERMTVTGDAMIVTQETARHHWRITLDPQARPRAMDMRIRLEKGQEFLLRAVYELEGDRLVICYDVSAWSRRPADVSGRGATTCRQEYRREGR